MTDQPVTPQFVDEAPYENQRRYVPPVRSAPRSSPALTEPVRPEHKLGLLATIDKPVLIAIGLLLAMGMMMVYSTTFFWSDAEFGNETVLLMRHAQNVGIGLVVMLIFFLLDYRIVRRLAVIIMLMAVSFLIAVLLFGDDTFGARRALIRGRFQPGEFSELAIIIYMAAWLGSKNMRIRSLAYGFIPFAILVGIVGALVMLQPDLSTAAVVFVTSGLMFFLAGADARQIVLAIIAVLLLIVGSVQFDLLPEYVVERVDSYTAGFNDILQTSYHTQQGLIAIYYGGLTGVGLGSGQAKFGALPASHTDSIFAVIGEELGVLGMAAVVIMYIAFVIRGFQISRRAADPFGALLAAGVSVWIATKALLNIAVMAALLPPSGLPLPFISFGGSSLVVLLAGVGLLLSVHRGTVIRQNTPERRSSLANYDRDRRDRGARVPGAGGSRSDAHTLP